jgi:predicted amidohydrolase YtcJ
MTLSIRAMGWALLALIVATPTLAKDQHGAITVFVAKKIVTMDPTQPAATAVAVRDGQILSVCSLPDLEPWLRNNEYTIDEQFKDKVLMPGFIDPHLHPLLGAIAFQTV